MTVYADVLLVINLFVNYILLSCSSGIMKRSASGGRLFLGAAAGSAYGLVIFLPELPVPAELIMRLAASALIVFCAFGYINIHMFLRAFFTFFAVSFAFGGIMLALWTTVAPTGMIYSNGIFYYDISLSVLAVSAIICFAVVSLISRFAARRAPRESLAAVTVSLGGKTVTTNGLIDTGNSLRENFSGYPVCTGEASVLKQLLPDAVRAYLDGKPPENGENLRLVVHTTVSGTGIMPAFRPDFIEVKTVSHTVRTDKVYIAVTDRTLAGGEYGMILNAQIFDEVKEHAEAY